MVHVTRAQIKRAKIFKPMKMRQVSGEWLVVTILKKMFEKPNLQLHVTKS
jgi:hypothetical protein